MTSALCPDIPCDMLFILFFGCFVLAIVWIGISSVSVLAIIWIILLALVLYSYDSTTDEPALVAGDDFVRYQPTDLFASSYGVEFTDFTNLSSPYTPVPTFYHLMCDTLASVVQEEDFNISSTTPVFFSECAFSRKCILDQFWYTVNQPPSFLSYNVTLSSFTASTIVKILVFIDAEDFTNYLLETSAVQPLTEYTLASNDDIFIFQSTEMPSIGYYFFVIEAVDSTTDLWFIVQHSGVRKYYAPSLVFKCSVSIDSDYCSIPGFVGANDSNCFLVNLLGIESNETHSGSVEDYATITVTSIPGVNYALLIPCIVDGILLLYTLFVLFVIYLGVRK